MFGRDFFGGSPFRRAQLRPTARMGGPRLGQTLVRCTPPDGSASLVFDTNYEGSGQCGAISTDVSNTQYPACVPDTRGLHFSGEWMPENCPATPAPGAEPPPTDQPSPPLMACPIGNHRYNLYVDAPPYPLVEEDVSEADANARAHILSADDPAGRCSMTTVPAPPEEPPPGEPPPPEEPPPPYYEPPLPPPPPPGQVRIQPGPFGAGGVRPQQVPISPKRTGMPMQRPTFTSCPGSRPPVKVRQLRAETSQARPDNFPDPDWKTI